MVDVALSTISHLIRIVVIVGTVDNLWELSEEVLFSVARISSAQLTDAGWVTGVPLREPIKLITR